MPDERKWSVIVAEDHPVYSAGLVAILQGLPEVGSVHPAYAGDEAVRLAERVRPHLVLMDIQMPGKSGVEACREIRALVPDCRILMLTMFDDDRSVFAAMRSGARGYLLKDADQDEIERAVRAVGEGEAIFSPAIAQRLIYYFETAAKRGPSTEAFPDLTEREREILDWIARGADNASIAKSTGISLKTMRNYVSTILNKLHAADRAQAIEMARKAGYGEPDGPG